MRCFTRVHMKKKICQISRSCLQHDELEHLSLFCAVSSWYLPPMKLSSETESREHFKTWSLIWGFFLSLFLLFDKKPVWKRLVSLICVQNSSPDLKRFQLSPDDFFLFRVLICVFSVCLMKPVFNFCTQFFSWFKMIWGQSRWFFNFEFLFQSRLSVWWKLHGKGFL